MSGTAARREATRLTPPPFGVALIRRERVGGPLELSFMDEAMARIAACSVDQFRAGAAGRAILALAGDLLARADAGGAHADAELVLGDGIVPGQRLHARLHMRFSAEGDAGIIVVVHDLTRPAGAATDDEAAGEAEPSIGAAIVRIDRDPGGAIQLRFVDDAVTGLIGDDVDRFAQSAAGRAIGERAARLHADGSGAINSAGSDLALPPFEGARGPLHARFIRMVTLKGEVVVACVLHDTESALYRERERIRRGEGLIRLLRLSEILLEHAPPDEGLERIVDVIASTPGFRSVAIAFRDDARRELVIRAHRGLAGHAPRQSFRHALAEGPCKLAMDERQVVVSRVPGADTFSLYVPILAGERVLGVIDVCADAAVPWSPWDEEIAGSYADYVAALVTGAPARPRSLGARDRDTIDIRHRLTPRQREVLLFLVDAGASNREIAERLGMTEATVKVHMRAILDRLGVTSRTEAVHLVYSKAAGWLAEMRRRRPDVLPATRTAA